LAVQKSKKSKNQKKKKFFLKIINIVRVQKKNILHKKSINTFDAYSKNF